MRLNNCRQSSLNTSLMGVIRGVLDYYGTPVSDGILFGGTGHAFLINIHDQICPSGPYCWNYDEFIRLLQNFGITMTNLGFYSPEDKIENRLQVDKLIRDHLDKGHPCSLLNMENQLIPGYEDDHFITIAPWPGNKDFPPQTLTFGSWKEFGEIFHCTFYTFRKTGEFDKKAIIRDGLHCALELYLTPEKFSREPYSGGIQAYDQWIHAIDDGHGKDLGNWWNAMVWGECRARAAAFMDEISEETDKTVRDLTDQLSDAYRTIAQNLVFISDKELISSQKIEFLEETKELEIDQIELLKQLQAIFV
ncbi:hypothetical protein K8T06_01245 [bacterium]|nr:hypothetical protein [bacterium]